MTRPDINYSVKVLSQFMHAPKRLYINLAMKVLRYMKRSPRLRLLLSATSKVEINAYCDSDWFICPMTRKSLSGYYIKLGEP